MDKSTADSSIQSEGEPLRVMLLADTHLLGPKRGHWFDKLRRSVHLIGIKIFSV